MDIREEGLKREEGEDFEKVHDVWCRYIDSIKLDPRANLNIKVSRVTEKTNRENVIYRRQQDRCVRSFLSRNATVRKSSRS